MDSQVKALTGLLKQQAGLYEALAEILTREKQAAIAASATTLEQIRLEKEPLLETMAEAEARRIDLTRQLALTLDLEPESVTLRSLADRIGGPAAIDLLQCRKELLGRIDASGRLNREVGDLLGCCLRLVRGTIALVTQLTQPGRTYHRSGRFAYHSNGGRILSGTV